MAQVEEMAAKEGPFPITLNYSGPFAADVCKSQALVEEGKYAEAAEVLSTLMTGQMADDWKQMLQSRRDILNKWSTSGHAELNDYRTFFLETGPQWFRNRTRPIASLWKMELGSEVDRYFLISELLSAKQDTTGQVIVLSSIPDISGIAKNDAAKALLAAGNVLRGLGNRLGAETNWSKVVLLYFESPAWPNAVFNLGILCKEQKRYAESIAFFKSLLESKPNATEAEVQIVKAYRNYSHRSALEISKCYEEMGDYHKSLDYAWLGKNDKRIAYLVIRSYGIWAIVIVLAIFGIRSYRKNKRTGSKIA